MKISNLSFFLFSFLLMDCYPITEAEVLPEPNQSRVHPSELFISYRGVVEVVNEDSLRIGGSSFREFDVFFEVSWIRGKEIIMSSEVYEFQEEDNNIYGTEDCAAYGIGANLNTFDTGFQKLTFVPDDDFWECMFEGGGGCDPLEEVFWFEVVIFGFCPLY